MINNKDELISTLKQLKTEEIQEREDIMSCPFCAEKIKSEAIKCKYCGSYLEKTHQGKNIVAYQHNNYILFILVSILIPLIGIILGIIYIGKENPIDKKLGEQCLGISIIVIILYSMVSPLSRQ